MTPKDQAHIVWRDIVELEHDANAQDGVVELVIERAIVAAVAAERERIIAWLDRREAEHWEAVEEVDDVTEASAEEVAAEECRIIARRLRAGAGGEESPPVP